MIDKITTPMSVLLGTDGCSGRQLTNDCACSTSPHAVLTQSTAAFAFGQRLVQAKARHFTVDSEHSILLPTDEGNQPAVVTRAALDLWRSFSNPHSAQEAITSYADGVESGTVIAAMDEFRRGGYLVNFPRANKQSTHIETLEAWLHVTDRCNLRCSYCFLPHENVDMPENVGRDAINASLNSAVKNNFSTLKIKYAGGEPLLRTKFVAALHQYACAQSETRGICLRGVVLTNGTLLSSENVRRIQSAGLELMISIDGLTGTQDCQRPYANGAGSAERVRQGIDRALDAGLSPCLSITVMPQNAADLPSLIEWVLDRDLPFSLNFYRETPLSYSHAEVQQQETVLIAGMLAAYGVIEQRLPNRSLLNGIADRANFAAPHEHTCGVGRNYLVFNPQGHVSKCQMTMTEHLTTTIDLDPLSTLTHDLHGLQNLPVSAKSECNTCEWQTWCSGGCPLLTLRMSGRYDTKSPYCRIYKAIYPEVVRLEGLRILKYSNSGMRM